MAQLYNVKSSNKDEIRRKKHKNRRFLSQLDMSVINHDISVKNSKIKRGEMKEYSVTGIQMCGCGSPGCAIHYNLEK